MKMRFLIDEYYPYYTIANDKVFVSFEIEASEKEARLIEKAEEMTDRAQEMIESKRKKKC